MTDIQPGLWHRKPKAPLRESPRMCRSQRMVKHAESCDVALLNACRCRRWLLRDELRAEDEDRGVGEGQD